MCRNRAGCLCVGGDEWQGSLTVDSGLREALDEFELFEDVVERNALCGELCLRDIVWAVALISRRGDVSAGALSSIRGFLACWRRPFRGG